VTYRGRVKNGVVVPEAGASLPEGAEVSIDLPPVAAANEAADEMAPLPSLLERMKSVVGTAKGLPSDFAINHDHYIHGQPKRQ
jgi:hypothetical protein